MTYYWPLVIWSYGKRNENTEKGSTNVKNIKYLYVEIIQNFCQSIEK